MRCPVQIECEECSNTGCINGEDDELLKPEQ